MRASHLTLMAFCHITVVALILYSTLIVLVESNPLDQALIAIGSEQTSAKVQDHKDQIKEAPEAKTAAQPVLENKPQDTIIQRAAPVSTSLNKPESKQPEPQVSQEVKVESIVEPRADPKGPVEELKPRIAFESTSKAVGQTHDGNQKNAIVSPLEMRKEIPKSTDNVEETPVQQQAPVQQLVQKVPVQLVSVQQIPVNPIVHIIEPEVGRGVHEVVSQIHQQAVVTQPLHIPVVPRVEVSSSLIKPKEALATDEKSGKVEEIPLVARAAEVDVTRKLPVESLVASVSVIEPSGEPVKESIVKVVQASPVLQQVEHEPLPVVVNGGLGPLYLLASTLCNQTMKQPPAEEKLSQLYNKRAAMRRSLFEYMSLKFTHLEKLSSRLNGGLEIIPVKAAPGTSSSAGWPVVGRCTAHDLKLMAEAAWCDSTPLGMIRPVPGSDLKAATIKNRRSTSEQQMQDDAALMSKILYMSADNSPALESTIASLNLNAQELATFKNSLEDYKCRRSALRMSKTLFEHLAEGQRELSGSWPELFGQMTHNECARKRMIDVVNALAGFRGEASSIRRDNLEYAFAVDDLRAKVLESDLNKPLTFDRQFIEVGQFLQQSVRLMLANIDPDRARLASARYRSLMMDDQCTELHQRLLSKNYPTDCNPIEFGQLPDVLRMTANSLELWSIEQEIAKYSNNRAEMGPSAREINECITNLMAK